MFVYVEWSYSDNSLNKIIIYFIRQAKSHPSNKYTISKEKFLLHEDTIYSNQYNFDYFYQDKVFYTRVKVGRFQNTDLKILTIHNTTNLSQSIQIYLFCVERTLLSACKNFYYREMFLDENNHQTQGIEQSQIDQILKDLVKKIKESGNEIFVDSNGHEYNLIIGNTKLDN